MHSAFKVKVVVLVVFITSAAILLWKKTRCYCSSTTVARVAESIQLTADEMLYVIGESNLSSAAVQFDSYLPFVRTQILAPSKSKSLRKSLPVLQSTREFGKLVDGILHGRRHGFFVECGAADGFNSQTQFFEVERSWTGLLIEADHVYFNELLKLNRQAYAFGGCLTPHRPKQVTFLAGGVFGFSDELRTEQSDQVRRARAAGREETSEYLVQCFPLGHLLASLGVKRVDFLSLDMQGGEPRILEALDFNALRIDVILVEVEHESPSEREILRNNMRALFNRTGLYREIATFDNDMVFQREDPRV